MVSIRNVEHGTFTPLVFSVAGGMGPIPSTFYKRLASMLSAKTQQSYIIQSNYSVLTSLH